MEPESRGLAEQELLAVLDELESIVTSGTVGGVTLSPEAYGLVYDLMDEVRGQPIGPRLSETAGDVP